MDADIQELLKNDTKVYIEVVEYRTAEGKVLPLQIIWEDGQKYTVDDILDTCRAASLKGGGAGLRYTVRIGGSTTYMWLEEDRFFVERKASQ